MSETNEAPNSLGSTVPGITPMGEGIGIPDRPTKEEINTNILALVTEDDPRPEFEGTFTRCIPDGQGGLTPPPFLPPGSAKCGEVPAVTYDVPNLEERLLSNDVVQASETDVLPPGFYVDTIGGAKEFLQARHFTQLLKEADGDQPPVYLLGSALFMSLYAPLGNGEAILFDFVGLNEFPPVVPPSWIDPDPTNDEPFNFLFIPFYTPTQILPRVAMGEPADPSDMADVTPYEWRVRQSMQRIQPGTDTFHVFLSHEDVDHVGGINHLLQDFPDAELYIKRTTHEHINEDNYPIETPEDQTTTVAMLNSIVDVDGVKVGYHNLDGGHGGDDTVAIIHNVCFTADQGGEPRGRMPFVRVSLAEDVEGYKGGLRSIIGLFRAGICDMHVPGHFGPAYEIDAEYTLRYMTDLELAIIAASLDELNEQAASVNSALAILGQIPSNGCPDPQPPGGCTIANDPTIPPEQKFGIAVQNGWVPPELPPFVPVATAILSLDPNGPQEARDDEQPTLGNFINGIAARAAQDPRLAARYSRRVGWNGILGDLEKMAEEFFIDRKAWHKFIREVPFGQPLPTSEEFYANPGLVAPEGLLNDVAPIRPPRLLCQLAPAEKQQQCKDNTYIGLPDPD